MEEKRSGSISTNLKLKLFETGHLLGNRTWDSKVRKTAAEILLFFPKSFINKHPEHLRVTVHPTSHGNTALFALPYLPQPPKCQPNSNCCPSSLLSSYVIFWHNGMLTIHICNSYVTSEHHRSYCTNTPLVAQSFPGSQEEAPEHCHCAISNQMQDH